MSDAVLSDLADSFTVAPMEGPDDAEPPNVVQLPRRKAAPERTTVGRARFAGNLCDLHPVHYHGDDDIPTVAVPTSFPCAKFSGLPGNGKGIKQPSIGKLFVTAALELVRPLMLIGMLLGGLYGFQHIILHGHGGFHLLRPQHSVSPANSGMPNSGEHPTASPVPSTGGNHSGGTTRHPASIHSGKDVAK